MEKNTTLFPLALCGYSLPHVMGYLKTQGGELPTNPLTPLGLLETAQEMGLAGAEFSLSALVPSFDGALIDTGEAKDWGQLAQERGLRIVADYGAILDNDAQHLKDALTLAAKSGAKVMRAVLSHLLCGDRRGLSEGWEAFREGLARRLQEVIPYAEEIGICIAVENHQDATSGDLLWLAEQVKHSAAFGVTLDAGNPLAVGEDPIAYTHRIAHIVRHIHLKDYTLHHAPEGYRLVRCVAGQGVIDFPEMLRICLRNGHDILPANEVAAQATRTVPYYEASWRACYPTEQHALFDEVLPLLEAQGRPANEPYSSAWERGAVSSTVVAEEWEVVRGSIAYFQNLRI